MKPTREERFWSKVRKDGPVMPGMRTACHVWTGALVNGYGAFQYATKKTRRAHIVAWEMQNGPIPPGQDVLHRCNNRPCVRHLYLGDDKQNARDRDLCGHTARGSRHGSVTCPGRLPRGATHWTNTRRTEVPRGESHGRALLSEKQVRSIRAEYNHAYGDLPRLAEKYNVGKAVIERIVRRETWRHVA